MRALVWKAPWGSIAAVGVLLVSGCATPGPTPRLAVALIVDMLPADYLARYGDHFGDRGFKRLTAEGAVFTNAHFTHVVTLSAPGHATIMAGAQPSTHGIVANQWYRPGTSEPIRSVDDPDYTTIGPIGFFDSQGFSPHYLEAATVGDQLKRRYGEEAKVWSVSLKARTAILSAGHSGDGAVWFLTKTGDFVTSDYYGELPPEWCTRLNEDNYADQFLGRKWDRFLPESAYTACDVDNAVYEQGPRILWLNTMPKVLGQSLPRPNRVYYEQLQCSPYGLEMIFELARQAVSQEALGKDEIPDLLVVSLSSVDFCGHFFGPDSHEMLDMMARADAQVAAWLKFLDESVGPDNYVVLLTGDHGVTPVPERALQAGLEGGRIDFNDLALDLHEALVKEFGPTEEAIYYVTAIDSASHWVYLNTKVLRYHGIDVNNAAHIAAEAAEQHEGIEAAVVAADLADKRTARLTPLERAIARSVYDNRSGDVYLHLKRNWCRTKAATGHGSYHNYNTHVPVVFTGPQFKSGTYGDRIDMTDVAPTLSEVLDVGAPPKSSGRVLKKALKR
jgi:predicted AlkP superfamily pyrophosphatase or phosphodiesterase